MQKKMGGPRGREHPRRSLWRERFASTALRRNVVPKHTRQTRIVARSWAAVGPRARHRAWCCCRFLVVCLFLPVCVGTTFPVGFALPTPTRAEEKNQARDARTNGGLSHFRPPPTFPFSRRSSPFARGQNPFAAFLAPPSQNPEHNTLCTFGAMMPHDTAPVVCVAFSFD